jgi:hypothetical protein
MQVWLSTFLCRMRHPLAPPLDSWNCPSTWKSSGSSMGDGDEQIGAVVCD